MVLPPSILDKNLLPFAGSIVFMWVPLTCGTNVKSITKSILPQIQGL